VGTKNNNRDGNLIITAGQEDAGDGNENIELL
jgi:hypothetical protein